MTKTRMGFIGVGGRGGQHVERVAQGYSHRAEVVALSDIDGENLDRVSAGLRGSNPETYADWKKLLERDDIDAVCVSTPQFAHCEITVAAFEADKHVYCEKPLALTVADCNRMIAAGEKAGKVFAVGQQMRYHQHLSRMSRLIDEGMIGTPYLVWLKEFRKPLGVTSHWMRDRSKSGGALVEKSCHHFDMFTWLLRTPPVKVFASGGQAVYKEVSGATNDILDHAWVTVEHEGGRKAMLGLCLFAELPTPKGGRIGTHVRDIGVIGDRAMITTEGFHLGRNLEVHYSDRADVTRMTLDPSKGQRDALFERDGNWGIWVDFFNCIEKGGKPIASGEIGREAVAVALAAEKSIETGEPVFVGDMS